MAGHVVGVELLVQPSSSIANDRGIELIGHRGCPEPTWWMLTLDVRSFEVLDPTATPTEPEFNAPTLSGRAPLFVEVDFESYRPCEPTSGTTRRFFDAVSGRYCFFASTLSVRLVGEKFDRGLWEFNLREAGIPKGSGRTIFSRISATTDPWPTPGPSGEPHATYTWRVRYTGVGALSVPIPPGARSLQITETNGANSTWRYLSPDTGFVTAPAGESAIVRPPSSLYLSPVVAPAGDYCFVWGIDF